MILIYIHCGGNRAPLNRESHLPHLPHLPHLTQNPTTLYIYIQNTNIVIINKNNNIYIYCGSVAELHVLPGVGSELHQLSNHANCCTCGTWGMRLILCEGKLDPRISASIPILQYFKLVTCLHTISRHLKPKDQFP